MKFDRNILEVWFQDKFSREKVKLSGHLGELSEVADESGEVESRGLGTSSKYSQMDEIENYLTELNC